MKYHLLILFIAYVTLIIILGYIRPQGRRSRYLIRKGLHLITGLVIFYLTFRFSRQTLLILFIAGTFFSFITFFIKRINFIHLTGDSSWGTLFYPLGILTSFLLLYKMPLYYFQISLLFLTISDTAANIGGYLVRRNPRFAILNESKTPIGIFLFAVTAFLISFFLLPKSDARTLSYLLLAVICAIHFEVISHKGSDNIAIPLGTAFFFWLTHEQRFNVEWIIAVIVFMALVSVLLNRSKILTRNGTIVAYLLGVYLFGILGLKWGIPVAFFFITSVIFTRINKWIHKKSRHTGQRNMWQVMANISTAVVCSILFLSSGQQIYIFLFLSAVAAVTADTWASEIGPVFHEKCFSLSGWRIAESGISGGISIAGTLAAFSGSFLVTLIAWMGLFQQMDIMRILIISFAGFLASFVDSLLGAFLEPRLNAMRYFLRRAEAESISPNDMINLLASFSAPLLFLLYSYLLG